MSTNTSGRGLAAGSVSRRDFLKLGGAGLAGAALLGSFGCGVGGGGPDSSGNFPERDITWIVPFAAGGGTDVYARQMAPLMGENLGVNIEVRNEPGAGSLLGIREAANAQPDGYTITNFNPPSSTITQLAEGEEAGVDLRELTYIGQMGSTSYVVFAQQNFSGDDLQSAIDQYNSGDLSVIAGQERGGAVELLAELMKDQYDWDWQEYVGYEGGGDVAAAVLRDEAPIGIATDTAALSGVDAGDFKILAVMQNEESPLYPDAETAVEQGFPDLDYVARLTRVVAGPPDMPEEVRQRLQEALEAVVTSEDTQEWSEETGNPVEWANAEAARETTENSFQIEEEAPNLQELIGA